MQRLLTEAYDEFELEERETAEVPVSVYVGSYPEDVKEETVMEETRGVLYSLYSVWLELRRLPQILVYCHGELNNP